MDPYGTSYILYKILGTLTAFPILQTFSLKSLERLLLCFSVRFDKKTHWKEEFDGGVEVGAGSETDGTTVDFADFFLEIIDILLLDFSLDFSEEDEFADADSLAFIAILFFAIFFFAFWPTCFGLGAISYNIAHVNLRKIHKSK